MTVRDNKDNVYEVLYRTHKQFSKGCDRVVVKKATNRSKRLYYALYDPFLDQIRSIAKA